MNRYTLIFPLILSPFFKQSLAAVLPAGTEIKVRMEEPISSKIRQTGYRFRATVGSELSINNKKILKQGTKATGKVTQLTKATKYKAAIIELTLTHLTINNKRINVKSYPIAGKGDNLYRSEIGTTNLDRDEITASTGNIISNDIPVLTIGSYIELSTGTTLYFILTSDVIY